MALLLAQGELKHHLIEAGSKVRYDRGDFLFCRGDEVRGVFLIINGEVRLGLDTKPSALPTRDLGPGCLLGVPATLSNSSYSLTAEVIADSEVIFITRPVMLELLREHTKLSFEVMNLLSEELAETRNALSRIHKTRA